MINTRTNPKCSFSHIARGDHANIIHMTHTRKMAHETLINKGNILQKSGIMSVSLVYVDLGGKRILIMWVDLQTLKRLYIDSHM